jgi:hypothetical protein
LDFTVDKGVNDATVRGLKVSEVTDDAVDDRKVFGSAEMN